MPQEPVHKRAIAFVDGQNLFFAAKTAFGYTWPNYAFPALAAEVCRLQGWDLVQTRFYTGIPDERRDPRWYGFWSAKLLGMSRRGVEVYSRPLRYRTKTVNLPAGQQATVVTAEEKGIDVRIAIDVIRFALRDAYDVAIVFSQDQDLSELCEEIRMISREQDRWIKIASAFPDSATAKNHRGIPRSDWIRISRDIYDGCLDADDHRRR